MTDKQDPSDGVSFTAALEAFLARVIPSPMAPEELERLQAHIMAVGKLVRKVEAARYHDDELVREAWAVVESYDMFPHEVASLRLKDPLDDRGNKPKPDERAVARVAELLFRKRTPRGIAYEQAAREQRAAELELEGLSPDDAIEKATREQEAELKDRPAGTRTSRAKRISRKFLSDEKNGHFDSY